MWWCSFCSLELFNFVELFILPRYELTTYLKNISRTCQIGTADSRLANTSEIANFSLILFLCRIFVVGPFLPASLTNFEIGLNFSCFQLCFVYFYNISSFAQKIEIVSKFTSKLFQLIRFYGEIQHILRPTINLDAFIKCSLAFVWCNKNHMNIIM